MVHLLLGLLVFGYIYEDADSLYVSDDSLTICGIHVYNQKVHIKGNSFITVRPWNGSDSAGTLYLSAPVIHIHDSVRLGHDAGYGFLGGRNGHPNGYGPGYGQAGTTGGGGGAGYGGAGGDGGDIEPGAGGPAYGNLSDTVVALGSGGATGWVSEVDGWGGNGGGIIALSGRKIIVDTAEILSTGGWGNDGSIEAGGGGSGGAIRLTADSVILRQSTISVLGGWGGNASYGGGGGGGGGRIKIFYMRMIDTVGTQWLISGGQGGIGELGSDGEAGQAGTRYISPVVVMEEANVGFKSNWNVHPNPAGTAFTVQSLDNPDHLEMFDCCGRLVKTILLSGSSARISSDDLLPGVYWLKLSGTNDIKKIVIVR